MFHLSCVKHYLQNALFCLSQPSKRYLVRIAKKTVFLDKDKKKIVLDNQNICDKHLPPV